MGQKKRILVLISEGGGGHLSAGIAISEALQNDYSVEVVNIVDKILFPLDPFRFFTRGRYNAENFYNFLLRRGWSFVINIYSMLGVLMGKLLKAQIRSLFSKYLSSVPSVDLIVSTMPFVNYGLVLAAEAFSIPFLLVPTDLDITTFVNGLKNKTLYPHFTCALAYDDAEIREKAMRAASFKDSQVVILGFPVRKGFRLYSETEQAELVSELKNQYGMYLKQGVKVITALMGRRGTNALLEQAQVIAYMNPEEIGACLEVNILVGDHRIVGEKIVSALQHQGAVPLSSSKGCVSMHCQNGNVVHIRAYTPDVDKFFACSDLIITKTGSCSVNEVIYTHTKMLLDNTRKASARHVKWETFNVEFVKERCIDGSAIQIGDSYETIAELKHKIIAALQNKQHVERKEALCSFSLPCFSEEIRKTVQKLI